MCVMEQPRQWEGLAPLGGYWAIDKKILSSVILSDAELYCFLLHLELWWNIFLCGVIFSYIELLWVKLIFLELSWIMGRYLALSWVTFVDLVLSRFPSIYLELPWATSNCVELLRAISIYLELFWTVSCHPVISRAFLSYLWLSGIDIESFYGFFSVPPVTFLENKLDHNFSRIIFMVEPCILGSVHCLLPTDALNVNCITLKCLKQ
jgi:hypothetical protein